MSAESPILCIVAPCHNEEAVIGIFHAQLTRVLDGLPGMRSRIYYIDDGSTDNTLARLEELAARDPRIRVYALSRNFGHQVAVSAGLDVARGDAVVMMDSDCQHPPELLPQMLERWRAGADVVAARRESTADAGRFKRFSSNAFYWIINRLSDTAVTPGVADFCLLSRRAHRALRAMPERHRFLRGMVAWLGFPRDTIAYQAPQRAAGTSKYNLTRMVRLAFDAVFSFSATPIKVATRIGMGLCCLGLLYLAGAFGASLLGVPMVRGWGSLISAVLVLNGMQMLFIGILGEYVARVFEESKARPLYFFKRTPRDKGRGVSSQTPPTIPPADRNAA